jgi:hypothetical protein
MEQGDPAPLRGPGRAQRYALHLPVLFRRVGDADWQSGTTENLSDSGAVIRAATPLMPATRIEVIISLPSSATQPGGCLTGQGQVVRSFSPLPQGNESAFAVTFNQYRLERREK